MRDGSLGIYIHIPFCIKKCNYCDFCSFPNADGSLASAYADELIRRIEDFSKGNGKRYVNTVYFGGGTPTLMPAEDFERIFDALGECFEIAKDSEITVECNPASIDENGLRRLREIGINRLSIGLQSAIERELVLLGRAHTLDDFCDTFFEARRAGFDNISVDLMYGIPEQTAQSLEKTLDRVVELNPEHISAYGLKIEEGTAFYRNRDRLSLPDDDECAELYTLCCRYLSERGYDRYEISNFARAGRESKHNLKYWCLDDYVGFGVAAHSCFAGARFGNSRDIDAFLRGEDISLEWQKISESDFATEYVMLGLRLASGIDVQEFYAATKKDFKQEYPMTDMLIKNGFMREESGRIAFTTKGFLVSNTILSQMLSFDD